MIVITTPTGRIGGELLDILLGEAPTRGEELRVVVRDPAKLTDAVRDRVDVVTGSHGDAEVVDRAFAGADAVFWLIPPNPQAPSLEAAYADFTRPATKAFADHGVGHVVGISALGRGTPVARRAGLVTASLDMDDLIAGSGVAYRALANPGFMENWLQQAAAIRDAGVITSTAAPEVKTPTATTRDIARAAADLLLDRSWTGTGEVPVLGPEDLSPNDMARIMSEVLGRPVRYERQSFDDVRAAFTGYGMGEAFVEGYIEMMRAKDDGIDLGVRRTPQTASPTTFRTWCEKVLKPAVEA